MNLHEEPVYYRLMLDHPVPWRYRAGVIYDAGDKIVVKEGQVSQVVFDAIWGVYCDILKHAENED